LCHLCHRFHDSHAPGSAWKGERAGIVPFVPLVPYSFTIEWRDVRSWEANTGLGRAKQETNEESNASKLALI